VFYDGIYDNMMGLLVLWCVLWWYLWCCDVMIWFMMLFMILWYMLWCYDMIYDVICDVTRYLKGFNQKRIIKAKTDEERAALIRDRDVYQIRETYWTRILYEALLPRLIEKEMQFKISYHSGTMIYSNRNKGDDGIGKTICIYSSVYDIYVDDCMTFMSRNTYM